ncbi:HET-domain-containing protein [Xylariaceae sp. AK1471]|nr:HET-domain-containing protein [Xylariaceae sp. AK1471]
MVVCTGNLRLYTRESTPIEIDTVLMGGPQKISATERATYQIVAIVILALLPVLWVVVILFGLLRGLLEGANIEETLGRIGGKILSVTLFPFRITYDNCVSLAQTLGIVSGWSSSRFWGVSQDLDDDDTHNRLPINIPPEHPQFISDTQTPYRSSPLQNADEFRLIIIYPALFNEVLRGELTTSNLSSPLKPQYDALSYTWADETGNKTRSKTFFLEGGRGTILITKNCDAAIRRLRHPQQKRWVWIDALCIDQDNDGERTYQVSIMPRIYLSAKKVVVYTGEGTPQTDKLFDWLNGLKTVELDIPSSADPSNVAENVTTKLERYWDISREGMMAFLKPAADARETSLSESEIINLVAEFFSRRWFRRVWVLQEVSLPNPRQTTVVCGAKSVSAMRALHLLFLLRNHPAAGMMRIFVLVRNTMKSREKSHLLDILIETRGREAEDPRDKIFGVLGIAKLMDNERFPELEADYRMTTREVYIRYSAFFIQHHGPGFFLSLLKSQQDLPGLPSWAADWTVPWPNYKAVAGRDLAAATRSANSKDSEAKFAKVDGHDVLTLTRPRILRGYFTTSCHDDGSSNINLEKVESLEEGKVLVEMYPGLAALLMSKIDHYSFIQTCPHALSEKSVEELVARWSSVIVDVEGPENQTGKDLSTSDYLGSVETFKIR